MTTVTVNGFKLRHDHFRTDEPHCMGMDLVTIEAATDGDEVELYSVTGNIVVNGKVLVEDAPLNIELLQNDPEYMLLRGDIYDEILERWYDRQAEKAEHLADLRNDEKWIDDREGA